jgi:hypothetical protein
MGILTGSICIWVFFIWLLIFDAAFLNSEFLPRHLFWLLLYLPFSFCLGMRYFSTRSALWSSWLSFFSISRFASVWEWGISLLGQPHGAADFAISVNFFSISRFASVWEWGISLLGQPHGATDSTVSRILLGPHSLLSFWVLSALFFNWFCLLFLLGF